MPARVAADEAPDVRAAVAENERAPLALLHRLSNDTDSGVRDALAENPQLPDLERYCVN